MKKYLSLILIAVLAGSLYLHAQATTPAPTPVSSLSSLATLLNNSVTTINNLTTTNATLTTANATLTAQLATANTTITNGNAQLAAVYAAANKLNMALPAASQVQGP